MAGRPSSFQRSEPLRPAVAQVPSSPAAEDVQLAYSIRLLVVERRASRSLSPAAPCSLPWMTDDAFALWRPISRIVL